MTESFRLRGSERHSALKEINGNLKIMLINFVLRFLPSSPSRRKSEKIAVIVELNNCETNCCMKLRFYEIVQGNIFFSLFLFASVQWKVVKLLFIVYQFRNYHCVHLSSVSSKCQKNKRGKKSRIKL